MSGARAPLPALGLILVGAITLIVSLFLTWSHQLPAAERAAFAGSALYEVARDPDALQVYAIAGEVLGVLALGVAVTGLWGRRPAGAVALLGVLIAVAFVVHAQSTPPTNGLLLTTTVHGRTHYVHDAASAGTGETVALIGLILAGVGLLFTCVMPLHKFDRQTN